jgi:hypothetical protein
MIAVSLMNDKHLRKALRQELRAKYGNDPHTAVVDEMSIEQGTARADLVLINGALHGFELKSDCDSLCRLTEQANAYNTVFDYVTLVVGERHLRRAVEIIPSWWGIRVARYQKNRLIMRDLKLPLANPDLDPLSVASLLRRDEALQLLNEIGTIRRMHSKTRGEICQTLIEEIEFHLLRKSVREYLRLRANLRSAARLESGDD